MGYKGRQPVALAIVDEIRKSEGRQLVSQSVENSIFFF